LTIEAAAMPCAAHSRPALRAFAGGEISLDVLLDSRLKRTRVSTRRWRTPPRRHKADAGIGPWLWREHSQALRGLIEQLVFGSTRRPPDHRWRQDLGALDSSSSFTIAGGFRLGRASRLCEAQLRSRCLIGVSSMSAAPAVRSIRLMIVSRRRAPRRDDLGGRSLQFHQMRGRLARRERRC